MPNFTPLAARFAALALAAIFTAPSTLADTEEALVLDPVVVVATRLQRPLSGIAAHVTVIDSNRLQRLLAEDVDGLFRYEPGLETERSGTRFGATGVNIRGIGGNRVAIEIDGIPLRDGFVIGAYSNAGRLPVETDRMKRVEILHGPASVLYGSKALGGVLAIDTWDPSDLVTDLDRPFALRAGSAYQGMDDSWAVSGTAAWAGESQGLLAAATRRTGHQRDNNAPAGAPQDFQTWRSDDYLVRYTWDNTRGGRLRVSASRYTRTADTELHSLLGQPPRFRNTTALLGDDREAAERLSLDYDFSFGGWDAATLRLFRTAQETGQFSHEERGNAPLPVVIDRRFEYGQDQIGLRSWAFREDRMGFAVHRLGLGADLLRNEVREMRDGVQAPIEGGEGSSVILGEDFPVRDFPISRTHEIGLWMQDEIGLADGRWQLVPALRWDSYRLDPRPDDIWNADNPGTEVVDVDASRLTPRLGLLYRPGGPWSLYAQYAEGFRAPPFQDANIGFHLPLFGYRAIPNANLESETSQALEAGLRHTTRTHRLALTFFHTDYDDFIESRVLVGRDPQSGELLFQSRNLDRARIRGLDLRYQQQLGAWWDSLQNWSLRLAGYWATGDNLGNGAPLNSISPPQAVLGLSWMSSDASWDLAVDATFTAGKSMDDIDTSDGARFATPGWTTFDLSAGWRPASTVELRVGLFNLLDERYWRWLDVANLAADDPVIALLARPGRNFSLNARFSF